MKIVINFRQLILLVLLGCGFMNTSNAEDKKQEQLLNTFAETLNVKYQLLTNIADEQCIESRADGNCFQVELTLTPSVTLNRNDWAIYYSQINPVQSDSSELFDIEHVNGDLHRIVPTDKFNGFKAGTSYSLPYRVDFWSLSETDALPNYILAVKGSGARIISSTQTVIDPETGLETTPFVQAFTSVEKHFKRSATDSTKWATAQRLFARNLQQKLPQHDLASAIIPTPNQVVVEDSSQLVDLSKGIEIISNDFTPEQINAALERLAKFGIHRKNGGQKLIINKVTTMLDKGSYQLNIDNKLIVINANDASGSFYALQSLASLVTLDNLMVPQMEIEDSPHYQFRSMMVDVARNFHSKQFILDLLEQMSAYKLNKLHLHLGDDEGWRLEIDGLPELTDVSSKRCFDLTEQRCLLPQLGAGIDVNSQVNGYYSKEDYQHILRFAKARHIQVIPSLDMPGHSRSSIVAMKARYNKFKALNQLDKAEQYLLHDPLDKTVYSSVQYYNDNTINVCLESSYDFIGKVMDEVKAMHSEAGHPLTRYHIGADETAGAWLESPACNEFIADNAFGITEKSQLGGYFIERVAQILLDKGIESAGWNDGLMHTSKSGMPEVVQANAWGAMYWQGHQAAHELANRNWQVVASNPDVTYFDFPYEADPKEHGYYWAIRYTNTEKLFQFMPDNLPVHAEFWLDRQENPYSADDTLIKNDDGTVKSGPLRPGNEFIGVQGQLWSENTRNDELAEYKIFPRLFALAERGWHSPTWHVPYNYKGAVYSQNTNSFNDKLRLARDNDWANFVDTIVHKELAKLDAADIHYRVPTLGGMIKNGQLLLNSTYPGLTMQYQLNDGKWLTWSNPVTMDQQQLKSTQIKIRALTKNGQRAGRALPVSTSHSGE